MALHFEKYAQEGNALINKLAADLDHPGERDRTSLLLKAVLHALRERITIPESFHLLSQLPMFLKGAYVDQWKYHEQPENYKSLTEFLGRVERLQHSFGEREFSWGQSTEELTRIVLSHLGETLTEGQVEHVLSNLPEEIREFAGNAMMKHEVE